MWHYVKTMIEITNDRRGFLNYKFLILENFIITLRNYEKNNKKFLHVRCFDVQEVILFVKKM